MIFCPLCANMLVISTATGDQMWACQACTYRFPIKKQVSFDFPPSFPSSSLSSLYRPSSFELTRLLSTDCSWIGHPTNQAETKGSRRRAGRKRGLGERRQDRRLALIFPFSSSFRLPQHHPDPLTPLLSFIFQLDARNVTTQKRSGCSSRSEVRMSP